ncbi:aminoglycoside phosphotransferase family protein [Streptomyces tanashiensis]|uniref:Aminoglycoside phosphotransferase family protein n=1 Tax=Streptomyces tanashiensis TaxID=67367 RepID=A0ABY6QWK6_9ACTN|nr:aminoglycoside phosphotransferase family protein [Streptomyces tanashiensis]UZX21378.1 aminoglycoside phosphotransferase family protein [Streptomyces tanashiensis]GGY54220.1 kinase [Streptomyces tanashiensis]
MGFEPPQRLARTLGETYGDAAAAEWLAKLPGLADEALGHASLDTERVMAPGGRSSLVVLVRRSDGSPAALKIAPPFTRPDLERDALAHWNGWGAVQLLGEAGEGALVLERLHPEVSLRSLPEAKALLEAAGTVRKLWVDPPAAHGFETVARRTARQAEAMEPYRADPAAGELTAAALAVREELVAAEAETVLLHGNFRQGKVLAGDRTPWLAVGPEPLVGERAYDLARLVRDRVEDLVAASSGASAARRRVNKLADSLDLDRERLRGWTLFRAVESGTRALAAGRRQDAELLLEFASWL